MQEYTFKYNLLRLAIANYKFVLGLTYAHEDGTLNKDLFKPSYRITDDATGIDFDFPFENTDQEIALQVKNLIHLSYAAIAIQLDKMLEDKLGKKERFNHPESDVVNAAKIVFMIRCAFGHNIVEPRWNATHEMYKGNFHIEEVNFSLDTTDLHGTNLSFAQIDGYFGILKIAQYIDSKFA